MLHRNRKVLFALIFALVCFLATTVIQQPAYAWSTGAAHDETQSTHMWIVDRSLDIMTRTTDSRVSPAEPALFKQWHTQWEQGLYDADHKNPYYNSGTYASHFYDPDTGKNFLGETSPTAMTEGVKYFTLAGQLYQQGDATDAFYDLGLSLHYFTDETQPMHAANFTEVDNPPNYHTKFEDYATQIQASFAVTDGNGYWNWQGSDPSQWIQAAGVSAKADFPSISTSQIKNWFYLALFSDTYAQKWRDADKPVIGKRLVEAQRQTAGFLHLWYTSYVA